MESADVCPDDNNDDLEADEIAWISGDIDDGESGNDAEATITLCTEEGLKGTCVSDDVDFVIP
jgi:hypothetical protein